MSALVKIGFKAETGQLRTAETDLNRLTKAGGRADKANASLGSSFAKLAGSVGLAAAALASLSKITAITREFNVLNAQLITATGSSENAAKAFEAIQEFAQNTPYDLQQVTKAFTQLVNLGLTPSEKALTSYGNTASAMGKDLSQLVEAVADAATGEFERLKEFGIKTKTEGDNLSFTFRGMKTTVKNNAKEIEGYLISLGENEFAGAMAQRMSTLDGKMSNLSDEWDTLFRNISEQGVGQLMVDSVDMGIAALQELNAQVASGQLKAELAAVGMQFDGFGRDIAATLDILTPLFDEASSRWGLSVNESARFMLDGFINMPENIRALVQLVTVELSYLVDAIPAFGDALDSSVGAVMVRVIKKGEAYGKSWADSLNPFSDGSFDLQSELDEVDRITNEMIDMAWAAANEKTDANQQARMSAIEGIIAERDADVNAFKDRINAAQELRKSYDEAQAARKLITGDRLEQFKVGGTGVPAVDTAAIKAAQKELKVYENSLENLIDKLDPLSAATKKFEANQKLLNKALASGDINLVRYDYLMTELEKSVAAVADKDLDDLISKASEFGGAWSQAGSDIVNAFGSAASVLDDFGSKMAGITDLQGELTKKRLEYADSSEEAKKIDLALFDLSQQAFQANIGAVGRLAGVTAKAFKEQSKERQALHRIETAFAAVEIALAAEKAIMNATAAVANQGSGDPYTAFGRIAAMAGIMGAILGVAGIAFGGGSSGGVDVGAIQDQQGTGTVLGSDDKSESILNAMDQYNDIGIDQLAELRGIRDAMVSLSNGIAQLAVSLVTSSKFGGGDVTGLGESQNLSGIVNFADKLGLSSILGVLGDNIIGSVLGGLFGSTKKKLVDSGIQFDSQTLGEIFSGQFEAVYYNVIETTKKKFWGLSKKTSTSIVTSAIEGTILEEFGTIFGYIGDTVTQSLDVLGITSEKALEDYVLSLGSISFKDMSGEEIQKELEAIFSQQADLIAKYMLPQISKWQKMGEGSFEALTRVAKEQAVFNDALSNLGISLVGVSSIMQIDVAQAIITMMGGLDEFASATGAYFSKFFSEAEQFAALGSSINDVFVQLGVTMPMSRESFKALVDGLDLTTEAGRQMFATLMQLVPSMDAYLSELEKQQAAAEKLLIDTAKEAYSALQKAVSAEKTRAQEAYSASQKVYQAEIERINGVRRAIEQVYETLQNNLANAATDLENSFSAAAGAITGQFDILQSNANSAEEALKNSFASEIDMINKSAEERKAALDNEADLIRQAASERISALQKEASAVSSNINELLSLSNSMGKAAGLVTTVKDALAAARAGDFSLAKALSVSDISSSGFSTEESLRAEQALQSNRLLEIGNLAGAQASIEEKTLEAINKQIESINNNANSQIAAIEEQKAAIDQQTAATIEALSNQLNSLLGIDTTVMSIEDAIKAYQDAQAELGSFDLEGQLAALESQKNSLLGINTNVLSISEAIAAYNAAQLALDEFGYDEQLDALSRQEELAMQQLDIAEKAYNDEIARLDLILADGEAQLNALLGIDDSILSVADAVLGLRDAILAYEQSNAAAAMQSNSNAVAAQQAAQASKEIADEIKKMREENTAAQKSIAKSSERTSNILTRIEQGGLETY